MCLLTDDYAHVLCLLTDKHNNKLNLNTTTYYAIKFVEDLPMIIPGQFGFNCPSGFREEAF